MSYIALYRKWRPKTFEDVVGQGRIMKTLQQAVENDKVAHAYLFSGPRGTGKTSTAKIFAKALNCVQDRHRILVMSVMYVNTLRVVNLLMWWKSMRHRTEVLKIFASCERL